MGKLPYELWKYTQNTNILKPKEKKKKRPHLHDKNIDK